MKLEFYWSGANFHKSCSILVVVSKLLDWLYGFETQWNHKSYSTSWVVLDQVWVFKLSCCGYSFQVTFLLLLLLQAIDEAAFSVAYANMCRCLIPVSKKTMCDDSLKISFCSYLVFHCHLTLQFLPELSQECWFCCFIGCIVGPTHSHTEPWAVALRTVLLLSCFRCRKKWWWRRRE